MKYGILYEQISDPGFPSGYWYAHIPSLGLTTHGNGIEGSRKAAQDLLEIWLAEKQANGEPVPAPSEFFFGTVDV